MSTRPHIVYVSRVFAGLYSTARQYCYEDPLTGAETGKGRAFEFYCYNAAELCVSAWKGGRQKKGTKRMLNAKYTFRYVSIRKICYSTMRIHICVVSS